MKISREDMRKIIREEANAAFEENKAALKVLSELDFLVRQDAQNNSKGDIKLLKYSLKQYIQKKRMRLTGEDFAV
jgi:DNA transposition AAA+ family ATPase